MVKTIRVSTITAQRLDILSKVLGQSKRSIVEKAINTFIRDQFYKKTNEEYAALKKDKNKWKEFVQEQKEWGYDPRGWVNCYF